MIDIMVSQEERNYLANKDEILPSEKSIKSERITSGKSCCVTNQTLRRKTAENIKPKQTARVLPMTRNTVSSCNSISDELSEKDYMTRNTGCASNPLLPAAIAIGSSARKQNSSNQNFCGLDKTQTSVKGKGRKRIATRNEGKRLEIATKRVKPTILPAPSAKATEEFEHFCAECKSEPGVRNSLNCSQQLQSVSSQPGQTSPEPRLMGENLLTMSLLSASQCHMATLQDEDGDTPLHIAIAQNNQGLTGYLVQLMSLAGLSVDIYNNLKQTPLHLAVITQQPQTIRSLVSAGANVNLQDRNGQTALHLACQRSDLMSLRELLQAQIPETANCEAGNFDGFKPLHLAVFVGSIELINCLVENGADINCKDGKSGRAPLHHAVETDNLTVISTLVGLGAKPNARSLSGCTPLQIAGGRGMDNITKILSENSTEGQKQSSSWQTTGAYK